MEDLMMHSHQEFDHILIDHTCMELIVHDISIEDQWIGCCHDFHSFECNSCLQGIMRESNNIITIGAQHDWSIMRVWSYKLVKGLPYISVLEPLLNYLFSLDGLPHSLILPP